MARTALEKDGWTITKDPLFFKLTQQFKINIDLGAEKFIAAEKATRQQWKSKALLVYLPFMNFIWL